MSLLKHPMNSEERKKLYLKFVEKHHDALLNIWKDPYIEEFVKQHKGLHSKHETFNGVHKLESCSIKCNGVDISDMITKCYSSKTSHWFIAWTDYEKHQNAIKTQRLSLQFGPSNYPCDLFNMEAFGMKDCVLIRIDKDIDIFDIGYFYDDKMFFNIENVTPPSTCIQNASLSNGSIEFLQFGTPAMRGENNVVGIIIGRKIVENGSTPNGIMLTPKILTVMDYLDELIKNDLMMAKLNIIIEMYNEFSSEFVDDSYVLVGEYDPKLDRICERMFRTEETSNIKKQKIDN